MLSSVESLLGQLRQKPWIGAILGFILGLIIGLPILGWYVFPVQWYDADVVHLRADLQDDYVRMAAGAYAQNRDIELAARRMAGFGAETDAALQHRPTPLCSTPSPLRSRLKPNRSPIYRSPSSSTARPSVSRRPIRRRVGAPRNGSCRLRRCF